MPVKTRNVQKPKPKPKQKKSENVKSTKLKTKGRSLKGMKGGSNTIIFLGQDDKASHVISSDDIDFITLAPILQEPYNLMIYMECCLLPKNATTNFDNLEMPFKNQATLQSDMLQCFMSGEKVKNPKIFAFFSNDTTVDHHQFILWNELSNYIDYYDPLYKIALEGLKRHGDSEIPENLV